eukprot:jgi/Bigna1/91233/estExt_fgenesh1_pg.C_930078
MPSTVGTPSTPLRLSAVLQNNSDDGDEKSDVQRDRDDVPFKPDSLSSNHKTSKSIADRKGTTPLLLLTSDRHGRSQSDTELELSARGSPRSLHGQRIVTACIFLEPDPKQFFGNESLERLVGKIKQIETKWNEMYGRGKKPDELKRKIKDSYKDQVSKWPPLTSADARIQTRKTVYPQNVELSEGVMNYVPLGAWIDGGTLRFGHTNEEKFRSYLHKYFPRCFGNTPRNLLAQPPLPMHVYAPHSMVLVSQYPLHATLLSYVESLFPTPDQASPYAYSDESIIRARRYLTPMAVETIWESLRNELMPNPGFPIRIRHINPVSGIHEITSRSLHNVTRARGISAPTRCERLDSHTECATMPRPNVDPDLMDLDLRAFLRRHVLDVELVIKMIHQLSTEGSLLILGKTPSLITLSCESLRALLTPVRSLQPFFFGALKKHILQHVDEEAKHQYDILVVDIDLNVFTVIPREERVKEHLHNDSLHSSLRQILGQYCRSTKTLGSPSSVPSSVGEGGARRLKRLIARMSSSAMGVTARKASLERKQKKTLKDRVKALNLWDSRSEGSFSGEDMVEWLRNVEGIRRYTAIQICQRAFERGYLRWFRSGNLRPFKAEKKRGYRWIPRQYAMLSQRMSAPRQAGGIRLSFDSKLHQKGEYPFVFKAKCAVKWMIGNKLAVEEKEVAKDLLRKVESLKLIRKTSHISNQVFRNKKWEEQTYNFSIDYLIYRVPVESLQTLVATINQSTEEETSAGTRETDVMEEDTEEMKFRLCELAWDLAENLEIRNRTYLFQTYEDCFVAEEAVTWMVDNEWAMDREHAVDMCRELGNAGVIKRVHKDHEFKDTYLFFRIDVGKISTLLSEAQHSCTDSEKKRITVGTRSLERLSIFLDEKDGNEGPHRGKTPMDKKDEFDRKEKVISICRLQAFDSERVLLKVNAEASTKVQMWETENNERDMQTFDGIVYAQYGDIDVTDIIISLGKELLKNTTMDIRPTTQNAILHQQTYLANRHGSVANVTDALRRQCRSGWLVLPKCLRLSNMFKINPARGKLRVRKTTRYVCGAKFCALLQSLYIIFNLMGNLKEIIIPDPIPECIRVQVGASSHWLRNPATRRQFELANPPSWTLPDASYMRKQLNKTERSRSRTPKSIHRASKLETKSFSRGNENSSSMEDKVSPPPNSPISQLSKIYAEEPGKPNDDSPLAFPKVEIESPKEKDDKHFRLVSEEIRSRVADAFFDLLKGYEHFRTVYRHRDDSKTSSASKRSISKQYAGFDRIGFLQSQPAADRSFMRAFTLTQAFSSFAKQPMRRWVQLSIKKRHLRKTSSMTLTLHDDGEVIHDDLHGIPPSGPLLRIRIRGMGGLQLKGKWQLGLSLLYQNETEENVGKTEMKSYPTPPSTSVRRIHIRDMTCEETRKEKFAITRRVKISANKKPLEIQFLGQITFAKILRTFDDVSSFLGSERDAKSGGPLFPSIAEMSGPPISSQESPAKSLLQISGENPKILIISEDLDAEIIVTTVIGILNRDLHSFEHRTDNSNLCKGNFEKQDSPRSMRHVSTDLFSLDGVSSSYSSGQNSMGLRSSPISFQHSLPPRKKNLIQKSHSDELGKNVHMSPVRKSRLRSKATTPPSRHGHSPVRSPKRISSPRRSRANSPNRNIWERYTPPSEKEGFDVVWDQSSFTVPIMRRIPKKGGQLPALRVGLCNDKGNEVGTACLSLRQVESQNGRYSSRWLALVPANNVRHKGRVIAHVKIDILFILGGAREHMTFLEDDSDPLFAGFDPRKYAVMPLTDRRVSLASRGLGNHEESQDKFLVRALSEAVSLATLKISRRQTVLSFSCRIDDAGARTLARGLEQAPTLNWLDIGWNEIGSKGAQALANVLRGVDARLSVLDLRGNPLDDQGVVHICRAMCQNSKLKSLNISQTGFGHEGALAVCEMVSKNKGMKCLKMNRNNFGYRFTASYKAARNFSQALQENVTLAAVHFANCNLNMEEMRMIGDSICSSRVLRHVDSYQEDLQGMREWEDLCTTMNLTVRRSQESLVKYLEAEPYVFFNKDFHIGDTHAKVPSLFAEGPRDFVHNLDYIARHVTGQRANCFLSLLNLSSESPHTLYE